MVTSTGDHHPCLYSYYNVYSRFFKTNIKFCKIDTSYIITRIQAKGFDETFYTRISTKRKEVRMLVEISERELFLIIVIVLELKSIF